jgi:hypothetical protein
MGDRLRPSSTSTEQLSFTRTIFIRFNNTTTQWVSIKLFTLSEHSIDEHTALSLLLRHARYRDSYAGTADEDMKTLHGPYRLDAIHPDSFIRVDAADAEGRLRTWAEQDVPLDDSTRQQLERELYPRLRTATSCYQLAELGDESQHDWGWVVGFTGFQEVVLIDRRTRSLALVVASDD